MILKHLTSSKGWTSLGLCVVFLAPMVSAALLYVYRDNININTRRSGELLTPPLESQQLELNVTKFLGKWQLVYLSPASCNSECEIQTKFLDNVRIALGKDKTRVVSRRIEKPKGDLPFKEGSVLIIDPKGWLVLHYTPELFNPKGILEDLRRLLRFSYVG
jgi:cytochrome oxidase Cu insertion factor (SCO1/SenC/PrrC family)